MEQETEREGASLNETPTWAVAIVITVMVISGFFIHICLKRFGKWLDKTKGKSLLAALEKIKDEMMLFGLLSLLMGHWIVFLAKICVRRSSALNKRFYPCAARADLRSASHTLVSRSIFMNTTVDREQVQTRHRSSYYCPEGKESFASHESLEQLHRFIFLLGITHVSYSFVSIALAMFKICSWRMWENQALTMATQNIEDSSEATSSNRKMTRLSTFIFNHTTHPWSKHRVLVWLLCFSRQFWSSINRSDYMALRFGFITNHQLPLSYDFHKYMLRSMDEEFSDVVGISVPLWIFAIFCILLNFHGTYTYLWLSFIPAVLILLIGTKLHRVVVKLAIEIMGPRGGYHQFNLRDDLFWFGKPKLLLHLIQLILFVNALEMATFLWSLWEIKESSCFMENRGFVVIRLTFGTITQFWCSFITFPLYVIITQMGSRLKRSVVSENVRASLSQWKNRVKAKQRASVGVGLLSKAANTSSDSLVDDMNKMDVRTSDCMEGSFTVVEHSSALHRDPSTSNQPVFEISLHSDSD